MIKVGCCGFPEGMREYWRRFRVVEVQKSFYRPPRRQTVQRWRREAPHDCEFTLKAWQLITHEPSSPTYRKAGLAIEAQRKDRYGFFKDSEEVWDAWQETRETAEALRAGVILFQCPARFTPTEQHIRNLVSFFARLREETRLRRESFQFVWEPRGQWPVETIAELCQRLGIVACVDPLAARPLWGEIGYFRMHGIGGYRYRYTDEDLASLLTRVPRDTVSYVMFNNAFMAEDAWRFQQLIAGG